MDLSGVYYTAVMVFGIGLLIFIHELGHYLVAKWADVRVEAFSLGFGPALIAKTVGETEYKLCVIPLGGYVKMAGELPGEAPDPESVGDAREFTSKSVGARAAIIGAGPAMNLLFALIVFPIIFSIGVTMHSPIAGTVVEGDPAWVAGLEYGDRIERINGRPIYRFEDIRFEVALGDDALDVEYLRDGKPHTTRIVPEYDEQHGFQRIGLGLAARRDRLRVMPKNGVVDEPLEVISINGRSFESYLDDSEFRIELERKDADLVLVVRRDGGPTTITIPPEMKPAKAPFLGIRFPGTSTIAAVRTADGTPKLPLAAKDRIVAVGGVEVRTEDGVRERVLAAPPGPVTLSVIQAKQPDGRATDVVVEAFADPAGREAAFEDLHFEAGTIVKPIEGFAAAKAGFQAGDEITHIDGEPVTTLKEIRKRIAGFDAAKKPDGWRFKLRRFHREGDRLRAEVVEIDAAPGRTQVNHALDNLFENEILVESVQFPFPDSLVRGVKYSAAWAYNIFNSLKSIFTGRLAASNLGGILSIGQVTYDRAKQGWMKLFYFLAILSVNLAIVNLLPIPILDGGQLLFLLAEKIKGSPVSERIQGLGQTIGLVIILALIVFVTFNDIQRLFG